MSAAAAHARPSFELQESAGRAGDVVRFSISGAAGSVSYELEVGDEDVLEGTGSGDVVSGTFTVPDLGDAARTVTVEAEIRESGKRKKAKRKLEYLGPALPVTDPPAPAVSSPVSAVAPPAPAVSAQPAPSPEQIHAANSGDGASPTPAPAATPPSSSRRPRQSRRRPAVEPPSRLGHSGDRGRSAHPGRGRRDRDAASKSPRSRRLVPLTAALFDGIPEPGARVLPGDGDGYFALNSIAPPTAALVATGAGNRGSASTAIVVPALLGLAATALAGTVLLRRRRLSGRPGRD